MLKVWTDLPRLRDPDRFEAWVHRILRNACYREGGYRRRLLPELRRGADGPIAIGDKQAILDRDQLDRGFERLSLEHRAVLVLTYHWSRADSLAHRRREASGGWPLPLGPSLLARFYSPSRCRPEPTIPTRA